jgi:hypothetical protein
MKVHTYLGLRYREVPSHGTCDGCDLKPPGLNEICYVNIWANNRSKVRVVCGVRDVKFKEIRDEE